ncbi:MAG: DNA-processing protein DprA, partial [Chloroflexota bacterium]
RRPTAYGRDVAERLTAELAGAGVTIVSGLARGIDTHAHRGALAGGGRTIAVLGHGIDTIYPPENQHLARQIVECGAVVTEYAVGIGPVGENFPPRNRIISGLAAGVLVVEAGEQSGALITSRFAGEEQGRDVFAVPGPITSRASRGCHQLIQDGAKLVTTAEDILLELNPHLSGPATQQLTLDLSLPPANGGVPTPAQDADHLLSAGAPDGVARDSGLLDALARLGEGGDGVHVDLLARHLGQPVQEITGALTLLEVQGRVRHAGGMRYTLVR